MIKKNILYFLIVVFSLILLVGCSSNSGKKNLDITNTVNKIKTEINFPEMVEISKNDVSNYYDFNISDVEDIYLSINASGGFPDEIAIVKVYSSNSIKYIKESLEKRKQQLIKTFENYQPNEMYKLNQSVIVSKDNYIAFIVSSNSNQAKNIFLNSFS